VITFSCPSCQRKCQVGDEMKGRKMKCPACGARVRNHPDGSFELLSVGAAAPGAPPPAPAPASGAPGPAADVPAPKESSAVMAVIPDLAGKLLSQGEEKQNTLLIWGLVAFLVVVLGGVGMILGNAVVTVAPAALALVAAFVWLTLRAKRRDAAYTKHREESKTEPIAKV
jgi:hypothetical protein